MFDGLLPAGFTTDISSTTVDVVNALSPVITLIIGVLLAALVVSVLIGALRR